MDDPSQRILMLNECDQSKTLVLWKERKRWPPEYCITHPFMHGIRNAAKPLSILGMVRRIYTPGPHFVFNSWAVSDTII